MAQARQERVKELLFFAFLVISVILVILVWVEGLRADAQTAPGYYRDAASSQEDGAVRPGQLETPEGPGAITTREAPVEHKGPGSHSQPTPTPTGRNLDGEEM